MLVPVLTLGRYRVLTGPGLLIMVGKRPSRLAGWLQLPSPLRDIAAVGCLHQVPKAIMAVRLSDIVCARANRGAPGTVGRGACLDPLWRKVKDGNRLAISRF
jgi:hypothetical protein